MSTDDSKPPKTPNNPTDFPIQEYRLVPADQYHEIDSEDEIDLIELAKTLWDNRTTIYKFLAVGFVLGILVALLSPKEYKAYATLMPEYSTEGGGSASGLLKQYGGLLGLSGGSYSSNSNAIRVELYPEIVNSLTFQYSLANQVFYYNDYDTSAPLIDYYTEIREPGLLPTVKEYTIGLPGKLIESLFGEEKLVDKSEANIDSSFILSLTKNEVGFIEFLRSKTGASLNDESGIISVSATMPNPELAAEVAQFTIQELTTYLTEYRIEKVQRDLGFIKEQLNKAEERFEEAQLALAEFVDSNQGSLSARAQIEQQNLNSEYNLAFDLYNTLTQQYEEAKLKVQEETPMFKVLQPVSVPVEKSSPKSLIIISSFMVLGTVLGAFWILIITIKNK
ncbi:Wzz/FepE/Etk N-terminal domain-containing protein [Balneola vulgaris]|uniref:Wzz/FepE/Etk N-terminal domain-containing protein n=1 Tax=Balneola vulgaris TaxID=287535 RepID=UPI00037D81FD|nr:Wzz/FepE/Etk N-terminal domain-containing protein [Balneola vulgaris]